MKDKLKSLVKSNSMTVIVDACHAIDELPDDPSTELVFQILENAGVQPYWHLINEVVQLCD